MRLLGTQEELPYDEEKKECPYCFCTLNKNNKATLSIAHPSMAFQTYTGCVFCIRRIQDQYDRFDFDHLL